MYSIYDPSVRLLVLHPYRFCRQTLKPLDKVQSFVRSCYLPEYSRIGFFTLSPVRHRPGQIGLYYDGSHLKHRVEPAAHVNSHLHSSTPKCFSMRLLTTISPSVVTSPVALKIQASTLTHHSLDQTQLGVEV